MDQNDFSYVLGGGRGRREKREEGAEGVRRKKKGGVKTEEERE